MYTRVFERGNEADGNYEVVNISEYGFEWYVNNVLVRTGLCENVNEDIMLLVSEGFEEVV